MGVSALRLALRATMMRTSIQTCTHTRRSTLNPSRVRIALLAAALILAITKQAHSGFGTQVPISAELGTSIAVSLFPVTIPLNQGKVFLTKPSLLFLDDERLGMQVTFQAYDHRPQQGIALSETGRARVSGVLGFDPVTRQVLLQRATLDKVEFDRSGEVSEQFSAQISATWQAQITDPIRSELPAHPYITPIKENIEDISYDGQNITINLVYR